MKQLWLALVGATMTLNLAAQESTADNTVLDAVTVIGEPTTAQRLPGSVHVLDQADLELSRVLTTAEALRRIPGINVRDEEGFGLRPNIGMRGLNPTRSTKVLLLEDGIPLAYAPYGDNASYYHPPIERFDRIEVLKGPAINAYGPQTLSGLINYITPIPAQNFTGGGSIAAGNRGYLNTHAWLSDNGLLFDVVHKEGDGARDNIESRVDDFNLKAVRGFGSHTLIARANFYTEDSQVTYSGLTDAELANFGFRYNPFKNDSFEAERFGASLTDEWKLDSASRLTTSLYYNRFSRDWWRQSSNSTDTQCGNPFRDARIAGNAVDPDSCNSVQGRLRNYYTLGVEPRYLRTWGEHEFMASLRVHRESQDRLQVNGTSPTARTGTLSESNKRHTDAYSAYLQNRFGLGALQITPGVRLETIRYERINRLTNAQGDESLTETLPSLGLSYALAPRIAAFGGYHRGFAPPRTEDIIAGNGTAVDVDAERSHNFEIGLRARPTAGLGIEAAAFRSDFSNQIAVGSIAGGSTPLAAGEALYQGLELGLRADLGVVLESAHNPFVQIGYTVTTTARSETPFTCLVVNAPNCPAIGATVPGSAAGNRMPYAPRELLTAALGYAHPVGVDARIEAQYIGEQFSDFANSVATNGTGQVGLIASSTVWNLAVNYRLPGPGLGFFAAAKNLFDKDYIVDRTRGIQTGAPRLVEAGVEYRF